MMSCLAGSEAIPESPSISLMHTANRTAYFVPKISRVADGVRLKAIPCH